MRFLACERTNGADFALTMSLLAKSYSPQAKLEKSIEENKSTSLKDVPVRQSEKRKRIARQGETRSSYEKTKRKIIREEWNFMVCFRTY